MCGIIGILSDQPAASRLVEALKRLEYRGYDSAGVALLEGGKLKRLRAPGKLNNLDEKVRELPLKAGVGIGHTRWATHGQPNETNAHPHASGRVAIVHNGIIENFRALREAMEKRGRKFETETDSETIAHLIDEGLSSGLSPKDAFKATLDQLRGAFAIAAIIEGWENLILGGRRGSPLVIGVGEKEMFLGSDALAVGPFTQRVIYMEEGDWCALTRTSFEIFDTAGKKVTRAEAHVPAAGAAAEKGNYRHFMQKEIYEQPDFAGIGKIQHGGQQGQARDPFLLARGEHRKRGCQQGSTDAETQCIDLLCPGDLPYRRQRLDDALVDVIIPGEA